MDPIHPIAPRPSPITPVGSARAKRVTRERDGGAGGRGGRGGSDLGERPAGARKPPERDDPEIVGNGPGEDDGEQRHRIDVRA